jgi:hypothetical protein
MKTEGQVRQQLKQVIFRHLKARLQDNFKRTPHRCRHNSDVELEPGQTVGICVYPQPDGPRGVPCDARLGGVEQAQGCDLFKPAKKKGAIKAEFQVLVGDRERGRLASEYPDIAALMWVLDEFELTDEEISQVEMDEDEDTKGFNWRRWPWSKGG